MATRSKTNSSVLNKRVENDLKVLAYLRDNIKCFTVGKLESPQKLTMFYAGYTAMRSIWDAKTRGGKLSTGDPELDKDLKNKSGKFIFRVNMEISHSIGEPTATLLRVTTFRYWANRILRQWG